MASDPATLMVPRAASAAKPRAGTTPWNDAQKIALACRMLAADDHESVLPGLVCVRSGEPGTFLTLPLGLGFEEVTASQVVTIDENLNLLRGERAPSGAVGFLVAIHHRRPDAHCLIHSHAPYAAALSMTGEALAVAHMDATMFHDDCAFLDEWPGNPVSEVEGEIIAAALGQKRAILLANHGLATAGASVEEAVYLAICFERAARMQMRARAMGALRPIDPAFARDAHDFMVSAPSVTSTFARWARQTLRREPDCLD